MEYMYSHCINSHQVCDMYEITSYVGVLFNILLILLQSMYKDNYLYNLYATNNSYYYNSLIEICKTFLYLYICDLIYKSYIKRI